MSRDLSEAGWGTWQDVHEERLAQLQTGVGIARSGVLADEHWLENEGVAEVHALLSELNIRYPEDAGNSKDAVVYQKRYVDTKGKHTVEIERQHRQYFIQEAVGGHVLQQTLVTLHTLERPGTIEVYRPSSEGKGLMRHIDSDPVATANHVRELVVSGTTERPLTRREKFRAWHLGAAATKG